MLSALSRKVDQKYLATLIPTTCIKELQEGDEDVSLIRLATMADLYTQQLLRDSVESTSKALILGRISEFGEFEIVESEFCDWGDEKEKTPQQLKKKEHAQTVALDILSNTALSMLEQVVLQGQLDEKQRDDEVKGDATSGNMASPHVRIARLIELGDDRTLTEASALILSEESNEDTTNLNPKEVQQLEALLRYLPPTDGI